MEEIRLLFIARTRVCFYFRCQVVAESEEGGEFELSSERVVIFGSVLDVGLYTSSVFTSRVTQIVQCDYGTG